VRSRDRVALTAHGGDDTRDQDGDDTGREAQQQPGDDVLHVVDVRGHPSGRHEHRTDPDEDAERPAMAQHQRRQEPSRGGMIGGEAVVGGVRKQRGRGRVLHERAWIDVQGTGYPDAQPEDGEAQDSLPTEPPLPRTVEG
jgi:hypothetical protein